jgi:hypothetical protein
MISAPCLVGAARRRWLLAGAVLSILVGTAARAEAQLRGVRFEITQVGDTTFRFPRGTAAWVREGVTGIVVDPTRRDVLVARFRLMAVDSGLATALVTGQTTRVSTDHVVVLSEPRRPWYRSLTFWSGTVLGLAVGVLAGSR